MHVRITIGILIFLLFLGCKSGDQNRSKDQELSGFQNKDSIIRRDDPKQPYYRFPSGREMLNYIHSQDFSYLTGLCNSPDNLDQYHSTLSRMLNLGVYLADLSYLILFEKTRKGESYFDAILRLTTDLRLALPDKQRLIERISDNLHNTDSLVEISEDYQSHVIDYLLETGQEKTLAIITAGSYIEGLYLAVHLAGDYKDNPETVQKIADQKYAVDHLMHFSRQYEGDLNIDQTLDYLVKLDDFYNSLPERKEETRVSRDQSNHLVFKGGNQVQMSAADWDQLKDLVVGLRNEIVQNKQPGHAAVY